MQQADDDPGKTLVVVGLQEKPGLFMEDLVGIPDLEATTGVPFQQASVTEPKPFTEGFLIITAETLCKVLTRIWFSAVRTIRSLFWSSFWLPVFP